MSDYNVCLTGKEKDNYINGRFVNQLPIISIEDNEYFIDKRLMELRSVSNPHDAISISEGDYNKLVTIVEKQG